jgi:hypothetical protein
MLPKFVLYKIAPIDNNKILYNNKIDLFIIYI